MEGYIWLKGSWVRLILYGKGGLRHYIYKSSKFVPIIICKGVYN